MAETDLEGPSPRAPFVDRRAVRSSPRTRMLLAAACIAVTAISLTTIRHLPTPISDLQLYASIARARQLYGVGVPTETWNSPTAVDHITFYGPVFFDLAAASMQWFGVKLLSFRLVSLLGMAVLLAAVALLARELSDSRDRWLWAVALTLFGPEGNLGMGAGVMHILAIALEVLALAVFVRGLRQSPGRSTAYGVIAGGVLATAAMTTPRSYLFIAAFFAAGLLLPLAGHPFRREARWQCAAAVLGFCVPFLVWITMSHGDPIRWVRYMAYIFSHEDTDVAILPTAIREWSFSWTPALTPLVGIVGALMAAAGIRRERRSPVAGSSAAAFALATAFITYVVHVVVLNYTFSSGGYFSLPLFVVVLAMPSRVFQVSRRTLALIVALILVCDGGLFGLKVVRAAATWSAGDPAPLNDFFLVHVPPGSAVIGPESPYFFPVERNGSRYRTVEARSWADWARWVPIVEPDSVRHASRLHEDPPADRFFVWPTDSPPPDEYRCATTHVVATFRPAPTYLYLLGPLGHPTDEGYPESILYHLPPGCPVGYDPTIGH